MANPYHHALSSAKRWGGTWHDYIEIHKWFDESKRITADPRHRSLRHHSEGIWESETVFGPVWEIKSTGRKVPTRLIGEQHVMEDFGGRIPTFQEWIEEISVKPWMMKATPLSKQLEE